MSNVTRTDSRRKGRREWKRKAILVERHVARDRTKKGEKADKKEAVEGAKERETSKKEENEREAKREEEKVAKNMRAEEKDKLRAMGAESSHQRRWAQKELATLKMLPICSRIARGKLHSHPAQRIER